MATGAPMSASEFAAALNVSRETLQRLQAYAELLRKWQARINLVASASLTDLWRRHFLDSGQLCPYVKANDSLVDIGSGAGFPGLVVAIMTNCRATLVESDQRKAAFLREASRVTNADTKVVAARAESAEPAPAEVVTARAVAPLERLLALAEPWLAPGGRCLFLKGAAIRAELTDASRFWNINYDLIPSMSDPAGVIVHVKEFQRV